MGKGFVGEDFGCLQAIAIIITQFFAGLAETVDSSLVLTFSVMVDPGLIADFCSLLPICDARKQVR